MFNNIFDSFQNAIAEAKQEREQLDRLLTISTPREHLLVAAIALVLLTLAVWLFFGSVTKSLAVDGVLVETGKNLSEENRSIQALTWINSEDALHILVGMNAMIELNSVDGQTVAVGAAVTKISAEPVTERLEMIESLAPLSVYRFDLFLEDALVFDAVEKNCRIVMHLGTQTPISLFRMR